MNKDRKVVRVNYDDGANAVEVTAGAIQEKAVEWIEEHYNRSAFRDGVTAAVVELLEELEERGEIIEGRDQLEALDALVTALMNGARNFREYSAGGCSLIANEDIAARYLPPSKRAPSHWGNLLEVQAAGLYRAALAIRNSAIELSRRA